MTPAAKRRIEFEVSLERLRMELREERRIANELRGELALLRLVISDFQLEGELRAALALREPAPADETAEPPTPSPRKPGTRRTAREPGVAEAAHARAEA